MHISIKSNTYFLFTLVVWAFLPSAPSIAASASTEEICRYRLVSFSNVDGLTRYGLALGDSPLPEAIADVSDEVAIVSDAFRARGLDHQAAFTSKELVERLQKRQCEINRGAGGFRAVRVSTDIILPAIPQPKNIVAVGQNTRSIVAQFGLSGPDGRVFAKRIALTSAYSEIARPAKSLTDGEVELGVVVRKRIAPGTEITRENIQEYIAGFVLANDVTNFVPIVLELFDGGFSIAKTAATFLPVGPYFVPIEALPVAVDFLLPAVNLTRATHRPLLARGNQLAPKVNEQLNRVSRDEYFADISAAIANILEKREQRERNVQGVEEPLLLNGVLEPGDLILMGSSAGVAFRAPAHAREISNWLLASAYYEYGVAYDYFFPAYQRYFSDSGGPFPLRSWQHWMAQKTHLVRLEYCGNHRYLYPGDIMVSGNEILGLQVNNVTEADPESDQYKSELQLGLSRAAFNSLCRENEMMRWQAAAGYAGLAASVGGGAAAGRYLGRRFIHSPGLLGRLARLGTTVVGGVAGLYPLPGVWSWGRGAYASEIPVDELERESRLLDAVEAESDR